MQGCGSGGARGCWLVLDKDDVAGRVDASCGGVVTPVAAVVTWVSEEDTGDGPWVELVCRCRGRVGVTQAAEDAEFSVGWWNAEEELVWRCGARCAEWAPIKQERRSL